MRRLHLRVGVFAVVAFLITGQFIRHHIPPMVALSDSVRLMFRSRHIYILAAGLVNLILGVYIFAAAGRGVAQSSSVRRFRASDSLARAAGSGIRS
jgi:hypothetical protein